MLSEGDKFERIHAYSGAFVCAVLMLGEWLWRGQLKLSYCFGAGLLFSALGLRCYRVIAEWTVGTREFTLPEGLAYMTLKFCVLITYVLVLVNAERNEALIMFAGSLYLLPLVILVSIRDAK